MLARLLAIAGVVGLVAAPAPPGAATGTAPPLVIRSVDALRGASGTLVRVRGTFPGSDMVQLPYEVHVLVRALDAVGRFEWFGLPDRAWRGEHALPAGRVDSRTLYDFARAPELDPESRLLQLSPDRLDLKIGPDFPAGPAEALIFVFYKGEIVFSNPLPFDIEDAAP